MGIASCFNNFVFDRLCRFYIC